MFMSKERSHITHHHFRQKNHFFFFFITVKIERTWPLVFPVKCMFQLQVNFILSYFNVTG